MESELEAEGQANYLQFVYCTLCAVKQYGVTRQALTTARGSLFWPTYRLIKITSKCDK